MHCGRRGKGHPNGPMPDRELTFIFDHATATDYEMHITRTFKIAALTFVVLIAVTAKVLQYIGFRIHDWDTGIYSNVVWNIFSGNGFYSDILSKNHLGEHFSPITAIFTPFYLIWPSALWLVMAQGLAVGLTCVLLYFYGRKFFSDARTQHAPLLALVFSVWALFFPPLTAAMLFQFHPSTLAIPFLAGALLALEYRRNLFFWMCVGLIFISKENGALAILGLGIYAALVQQRYQMGLLLAAMAVLGALVSLGIVIPAFQEDNWHHYSRLDPFADLGWKALYLTGLLGGLLFLPLACWRALICAAPLVLLNLSVGYWPQYSLGYQYNDFASIFLIVAAMHGTIPVLSRLSKLLDGRRSPAVTTVIISSTCIASLVGVGLIARDFALSWPQDHHWQLHRELTKYRAHPDSVGFSADYRLGPYLSARRRFVPLRSPENLERLKQHDLVLITPIGDTRNFNHMKTMMEGNNTWKLDYQSPVIRVYSRN